MSFLGQLLGADGCVADGAAASNAFLEMLDGATHMLPTEEAYFGLDEDACYASDTGQFLDQGDFEPPFELEAPHFLPPGHHFTPWPHFLSQRLVSTSSQEAKAQLQVPLELEDVQLDSHESHLAVDANKYYSFSARFSNLSAESADDMFAVGMKLFTDGLLEDSIERFEFIVQDRSDSEHVAEAWRMLGLCHAEGDEDVKAIYCFNKSVEQDPYSLDSLLSLGVSHVNELDSAKALATLRTWLQHNPKYSSLEFVPDAYSDGTLMDEVSQLMLTAVAHETNDPGVAVVLGVLNNVSEDYSSAVHYFEQALACSLPADRYTLLNKLGATLANSNRSAEAIPMYEEALRIRPRYVRAWLNKGIAHANLGNYEEACRSYLRAIRLNPGARHIWRYLSSALAFAGRKDLLAEATTENVEALTVALGVP